MAIAVFLGATCQLFDDDGDPLASGKVYFYERGTATPKDTYTDEGLGTPNANPVILDSSGRAQIFLDGSYKIVVHDSDDVLIDEIDPANYSSTASTTAGSGGNLLSNASFEDNTAGDSKTPDGWTLTEYTGSTVTLDTADPSHGAKCVKATSAGNGGCLYETTDYFEVSEDRPLSVSFQVKSDQAAVHNLVEIQWYTAAQASLSTTSIWDDTATNPAAWTLKSFKVTPPATARYAKLRLYACHSDDAQTGTTRYDNVYVTEYASHPGVTLTGLSAGIIARITADPGYAVRTLTAADTSITISDGDGDTGNPTFEVPGGFKAVASDEGSPADGETWYNTTTKQYKGYRGAATGVWTLNATLAVAVVYAGGFGTTNSAAAVAGGTSAGDTYEARTQEFDGASWSVVSGGDLNTQRHSATAGGTQAAGIIVCGVTTGSALTAVVETYDGATWTSHGTAHSSARWLHGGCGSAIDYLTVGGVDAGGRDDDTYEWNDTAWSAGGGYTLAYSQLGATGGLLTTAIAFGGSNDGSTKHDDCKTYDGVSWTTENNIGANRWYVDGGGDKSDAWLAGGYAPDYAAAESWNGTDWSSIGDLNTGRFGHSGTGVSSDGMVVGGTDGGLISTSESNTAVAAGTVIFTITAEP